MGAINKKKKQMDKPTNEQKMESIDRSPNHDPIYDLVVKPFIIMLGLCVGRRVPTHNLRHGTSVGRRLVAAFMAL